jgi:hypothetical protein
MAKIRYLGESNGIQFRASNGQGEMTGRKACLYLPVTDELER